jgi:plastocyanin
MKLSTLKEPGMNNKIKALLGTILILMFLFALVPTGCSSSNPPNTITMAHLMYSPTTLTVSVGTTVTWKNTDTIQHSVTSDTGLFDSGLFSPGGSYTHTFDTAGTYPYHCTIHAGMVGTIIVH